MARDRAGNRLRAARSINAIARDQVFRDVIGGGDSNDFYRVRLDRTTSLNLELSGLTTNANLQLLNQRGRVLQTSARPGNRPDSIFRTLLAGTYFIRVFGGQRGTRYAMKLSAYADAAGDTLSSAQDLGIVGNASVQDWVGRSDRSDYYKFSVASASQLTVGLSNLASDANIQLLSGDGSVLQASTNPGTTTEAINTSLAAGNYYLHVFPGTPTASTSYQLSVAATPSSSPTPTTPFPTGITLQPVITGLNQPVYVTHAGDGTNRLFIVEQDGQIRILQNGSLLPTPFLDISDRSLNVGEQGLLSVAFPPDYANKGHFYVYYTNNAGNNVVARYRITSANVANPNSEEIVLPLNHPTYANHNGGQLAFGPDGFLYIATGDGGGGGDPNNNAQTGTSLLGKLLRIDVESPGVTTYTIPSSNPFTATNDPSNAFRDEIWAYGLRNPWRFSFDRQTGDLYMGDVGQGALEEVNFQSANSPGGQNYGWRLMEGSQRYNNYAGSIAGLTLPVAEYGRSLGSSITGGFVHRSSANPTLQGVYFYGDFITGRVWGLRRNGNLWENGLLTDTDYSISTFGQDEQGNVYLADYSGGLYRIGA
ncbi:PQQ-dependent sugar dehydrogenase [Oscillatoria sp. FACHB-1407]|uniref:PQQ-dependent sugar dehydrogenase n=1 Tax=Oscillatoria sp. FACHB-1407 TaxID=2692847 RepID=UPI0016856E07|nr:PQQ-dependent sugar dehydrogenase [Oscillatoria sp. FACHB-1407]MBD2460571.1 PQQ-dependent sugar dehydrogenase [Oscillatoria sp. FACHB-1407]